MRSVLRVGFALSLATLWTVWSSEAQDGLTKRDGRGPVTVVITLTAPPAIGVPVKAKVVLDTHSVALDGIAFEAVVAMRTPDGTDVAPVAIEQATGSGHPREAVVVFPPIAAPGAVRIVVKNVGGVAERSFSWDTPPAR